MSTDDPVVEPNNFMTADMAREHSRRRRALKDTLKVHTEREKPAAKVAASLIDEGANPVRHGLEQQIVQARLFTVPVRDEHGQDKAEREVIALELCDPFFQRLLHDRLRRCCGDDDGAAGPGIEQGRRARLAWGNAYVAIVLMACGAALIALSQV